MRPTLASARTTLIGIAIVLALSVWLLRDLTLLVGYAIVLAYALLPIVTAVERVTDRTGRNVPRAVIAAIVVIALVALIGWLLSLAVPRVIAEATHLASQAPAMLDEADRRIRAFGAFHGLSGWLDPAVAGIRQGATDSVQNGGAFIATAAGKLFGGLGLLVGILLLPLLTFYLLADSEAVTESWLQFVPEGSRDDIAHLGTAVDRALRSYIRGQALVCLVTGAVVGVALALIQHPAALLLGLVVGAAELVPFVGFAIAATAIVVTGAAVSPFQAGLGLGLYIVLNWATGAFITPRVMGRYLKMHPFVVTVSVLAGARLLGPAGALLALPGAAVIQAIIGEYAPPSKRAAKGGTKEPARESPKDAAKS